MGTRRGDGGFSLVEILIVVMVLGIIAAIAIPNLLNAIQRGRQKRTIGDIRSVATALEAYAIDNGLYPSSPATGPLDAVAASLEPTYAAAIPRADGWGTPFDYVTDAAGSAYTVTSYGKDRVPSGPASGSFSDMRHDVVFSTGAFVTWPEGAQE
jgi:general secretion pathway protein G